MLENRFLSQLSPSASSYPTPPPAPPMRWTARGMMKWMGTAAPPAGAGPSAILPSGPLQPAGHPRPSGLTYCIIGNRSWLLSSSPVKTIIMYNVYLVYCSRRNVGNFFEVRQIGLMTHSECRVNLPFPNQVIRCWVRTNPPPFLQYGHGTDYLTPFCRLNPQTPKADLWTCDQHAWFSLIYIYTVFVSV